MRTPALLFSAALMLTLGCATPHTQVRRSSLMGYLYPKASEAPKPDPAGASLQLPLKLGIVFVPGGTADWRNDAVVAADAERPLLDTVRGAFKERPWVGDIKIIPSAYLRAGGGFENLDQASRMFGVDVIALVSVDQIQQTDPKWYSFTYLSILGAFVVPAERNSTRTLIDAAVFHVPTRTFLLRAPGQSFIKGSTTMVAQAELLRRDAGEGLKLAMVELGKNLDSEVAGFKAEVAQGERKDVDLVDRSGQSLRQTGGRGWGGALSRWEVLGAGLLLLLAWRRESR